MAFHALLCVRDEADIISQSLDAMLQWADYVHVFDTGSVDDTWELITARCASDKRVIPHVKRSVFFDDSTVRSELFNLARGRMAVGDWFLRADADEFHHIPPPDFVRERLRLGETSVWHQYYDFVFTDHDLKAWSGGAETLEGRKRPIAERRRYYRVFEHSEPRMFQYRSGMVWPPNRSCPFNAGFVAKDRLPIRHYPNRDPIQMIRRCALRRAIMEEKSTLEAGCIAPHWKLDWEEFVVKQDDPGLHYWAPDTRFELVQQADHWKRVPSWKRSLRNAPLAGPLYNAAATISDALRRNKVFRSALRPISPDRAKVIARAMQAPNRDIF